TGRRDYTVKREGYARYGVREYWRFDPSGGEWHDAPLAGDVLIDGEYVPVEIVSEADGSHWGYSEILGLELWWVKGEAGWECGDLRFRDRASGEFLPTPEESRAEVEAQRARAEAAEAELRRLRGE
ncbi:MAG: Uma2 family endonuclease, partial [Dehalococcoidia bacterium]|nr:Uma2 family endonuclease [Dehalococcoidia bacterium]